MVISKCTFTIKQLKSLIQALMRERRALDRKGFIRVAAIKLREWMHTRLAIILCSYLCLVISFLFTLKLAEIINQTWNTLQVIKLIEVRLFNFK